MKKNSKYFLGYLFLLSVTARILWLMESFTYKSVGLSGIVLALLVYWAFKKAALLDHIREDYVNYNKDLIKKKSLLKWEWSFIYSFIGSSIFNCVLPNETTAFLVSLSSLALIIFVGYRIWVILTSPEIIVKYHNYAGPNSLNFQTRGMTFTKMFVTACLECGKFVAPTIGLGVMAPKIIYGYDYRSPVSNLIAAPFTGVGSNNEGIYSLGATIVTDPSYTHLRPKLVGPDGFTLDRNRMFETCKVNPGLQAKYPTIRAFVIGVEGLDALFKTSDPK